MNSSETVPSTCHVAMNEECRQTRFELPRELFGELDEPSSSGLFEHIRRCRGCLEAYVALQAAAELAGSGGVEAS